MLHRPHSLRFASQLRDGSMKKTAGTPLLSRLSERTQRNSNAEQKSTRAPALHIEPRPRATSLISTRSAQKRDHAAEKWFTDVRKLDIDIAALPQSPSPVKRKDFEPLKPHEMRPRTDLNALFAPPTPPSDALLRLQTKRELGGDYTSYLPDGCADPIDYARLVLGRNKDIPLSAQAGALRIIQNAVQGRPPRQVV